MQQVNMPSHSDPEKELFTNQVYLYKSIWTESWVTHFHSLKINNHSLQREYRLYLKYWISSDIRLGKTKLFM